MTSSVQLPAGSSPTAVSQSKLASFVQSTGTSSEGGAGFSVGLGVG